MAETERKVRVYIPLDPLNPKTNPTMKVIINGKEWLIKRGNFVELPEQVAEVVTTTMQGEAVIDAIPVEEQV